LKTAVSDLGFLVPLFRKPLFPTVDFQKSEMPIMLLGVGTNPLPANSHFPTPNNTI
jgi:hypothetical protein